MAGATSPSTGSTPRRRLQPERQVAGGVAALLAALWAATGSAAWATMRWRRPRCWRPTVPCQALCGLLRGVAEHLRGDSEAARRQLEAAARRAAVSAPQVHALCLAQLALIALDDDDPEGAARLITRARSQVARYGLARYPTSAARPGRLGARARAARTRRGGARRRAPRPRALLERLTDLAPWYEARGADRARARRAATERRQRGADAAGRRPRGLHDRLPEAVALRRLAARGRGRPRGVHARGAARCRRR